MRSLCSRLYFFLQFLKIHINRRENKYRKKTGEFTRFFTGGFLQLYTG
jgi:hypothetical protein